MAVEDHLNCDNSPNLHILSWPTNLSAKQYLSLSLSLSLNSSSLLKTKIMASKLEIEVEVTSSAENLWEGIKLSAELFPQIFPQQYKSIQVIEGDGQSVGTIRVVNYGEGMPFIKFAKEKIEVADEENKLVSYSVIEGEILNYYKLFRPTLQVASKGNGAVVKWIVEYEKASDEVPEPELIKEMAVQTFKELDEYLLKNLGGAD